MASYDKLSGDLNEQVRQLRDQVQQLSRERVGPVLSDAASRAQDAANRARDYTADQAEYVAERVRDQPLIAIGVAAAVGYVLGRITR